MPTKSLGELVEVETGDRLRLHGFLQSNTFTDQNGSSDFPLLPDAWIVSHGVAGNFYGSSLLGQLAETLLQTCGAVVRVNTRGHDVISFTTTPGGQARTGAAYEDLAHSSADLAAWVELLKGRGYRKIGLAGHSLGAVKSIYAAACNVPATAIIAVSPPRFNPARFSHDAQAELYRETLASAQQFCQSGQPDQLIRSRFPFPMQIAAAAYVEKYGSDRYDYFPLRQKLAAPVLFTFGSLELVPGKSSFDGMPEKLIQSGFAACPSAVEVIAHADHAYKTGRGSLMTTVRKWLEGLTSHKVGETASFSPGT